MPLSFKPFSVLGHWRGEHKRALCSATTPFDIQLLVISVGGSQNLRFYWNQYLSKSHVLVFVVDSADGLRLPTARQELHCLLAEDPQLPLIVLANKQVGSLPFSRSDCVRRLCNFCSPSQHNTLERTDGNSSPSVSGGPQFSLPRFGAK